MTAANLDHANSARALIIDAGAVLDGTGARARSGQSVLVIGERIAAVGAPPEIRKRPDSAGATVIDASTLR